MSANVGKPFALAEVTDGVTGARALEDTELRASDGDRRDAERVPEPECWPVSEPVAEAAETEEVREKPETEGHTLSATMLGLWLAALALRPSHADCRVGGRGEVGDIFVGPALPLLRPLELTLAGAGGRLLRETALLV